jgi:predicted  nucleic acid-binding Zn-ribbon protein
MATAPRRMSGGGLTGLHYALIVFVILTVASLGAFIYTLTIVQGAQEEAQRQRQRANRFGDPPPYYVDEAQARGTPVSQVMNDERKALATLVTGVSEHVGAHVQQQTDLLLQQVRLNHPNTINEGDALLTVVRNLDRKLTSTNRDLRNRQEEVTRLQDQGKTLNESIKIVKDDFASQVDALNDRLSEVSAEFTRTLEQKDQQLTGIESNAEQAREELTSAQQERRLQEKQWDIERQSFDNRIATLRQQLEQVKPTSFDPTEILTKADGRILRAIPGSSSVYVNLGEEDGIKIGMGFEIFSPTRERGDSLRGKASVEVVSLQPHTAECRVTRTTIGRPIIENDIIVNISYERGRRPKFVIAGGFDLNYDGVEDFDGREKITAMIREWGGQVADALDSTTDFVVVGAAPNATPTMGGDTDVVIAQKQAQEVEREEFQDMMTEARALSVPVINQSQFLFLTGYAGGQMSLAGR